MHDVYEIVIASGVCCVYDVNKMVALNNISYITIYIYR